MKLQYSKLRKIYFQNHNSPIWGPTIIWMVRFCIFFTYFFRSNIFIKSQIFIAAMFSSSLLHCLFEQYHEMHLPWFIYSTLVLYLINIEWTWVWVWSWLLLWILYLKVWKTVALLDFNCNSYFILDDISDEFMRLTAVWWT